MFILLFSPADIALSLTSSIDTLLIKIVEPDASIASPLILEKFELVRLPLEKSKSISLF